MKNLQELYNVKTQLLAVKSYDVSIWLKELEQLITKVKTN